MKHKLLAIVVVALFFSNCLSAQLFSGNVNGKDSTLPKMELGIKAGSTTQSISGDQWLHDYQTGIQAGFFVKMHKNKFGGRLEILASTFHLTSPVLTDTFGNKGEFRATYIDIPLLLEYRIIPFLSVNAGLQYSNLVSIKNISDITGGFKKIFKQGEFALLVGIEGKLPMNFAIGARYKYGFSDLNNHDVSTYSDNWKTNAIQAYIAYTIK